MDTDFEKLLQIARDNIAHNPDLEKKTTEGKANQYIQGLLEEIDEVSAEIKPNNAIFLTDELSDIAWDYACVLASLESGGYIESAETVLRHGLEKYTERAPAFLDSSQDNWNTVKANQKDALKKSHLNKYGN